MMTAVDEKCKNKSTLAQVPASLAIIIHLRDEREDRIYLKQFQSFG